MYKIKVVLLAFFLWSCQALPLLLFSNRKDIRLIDVESHRKNNSSNILINHLEDAAALDFYYTDGMVFWTDFGLEMIKGMQINDSKTQRDIITTGLLSPDGLACDWLGRKLYWTDSDTNRIEVSNLDGSYRKVLFWKDLDQPRAIALVPMDGLMFWTDWGEMPKIERASMDGKHSTRKIIVSENIFWPNGLTIDYETKRVYWVDAKLKFISGMDFEGKNRKIVADRDLLHPFSLTLYKDRLYWTDWQMKSVQSCNKYDGQQKRSVMGGGFLTPMGIHVYLSERQPQGPTPCDSNNGGCSHLCLMSSYKPYFSCACPTGVNLLDNKTCADGPQEILLLARRTDIRRISLDTPDYTDVVLQLEGIRHAIAVDYDPIEHTIYWTDDEAQFIQRANLDGTEQEDLVTTEVHHPDGIAIDWIARNLYWTDTGTDRIEVARLNGTSRKILITKNLDEPRAIVVDPPEGYMYWTDWGNNPLIERAHLDGTNRLSIINSSLGWPNGLSIDYETRKLYWGDAKTDKIEMANLDGSDRRELVSDQLPHIFGFSLLGDFVYWTDWQRRSIERVHKLTGDGRETIVDQLPDLMGLKAINVYKTHGTSPCAVNNGNCSHLCLNKPNGKYVCSCPMGLVLTSDFMTCIVPEAFLLFSRRADIRRISLESKLDDIIPVSGVAEAYALDYDINDNRIYWTDTSYKTINRAFMNGSNIEHLIQFGLEYPEGIAVDWIAHNLYWADTGSNRIEVARLDGSYRRVLIWQDLDEPRSLTLDPSEGYMYWVDWGSNPRIERSAMDGSYRTTLISKVGKANGLTIDYKERRLYWTDIDAKLIESSDLTGTSRSQVVSANLFKPYTLTQYQDYIYWADWATGSIERAAKTNGENRTRIQSQLDYVVDILVYHMSRQSGWNPCAVNNGGCSHLCLALPSQINQKSYNYCCSCPSHYELGRDNKTCISPKNFILFSQKNTIGQMLPDVQNSPDIILPIPQLKSLKAIEYDIIDKFIYWIDGRTHVIRRAYDNGTMASTVVHNPSDIIHPFDMVIEPFSRILYWSCAQNNVINVTRLNGKAIGIIVNGSSDEKPRHLALHHRKGLIFWTNIAHPPRIESASLDGRRKRDIVAEGLVQPGALTVDSSRDLIFWSDLNTKKIEMMDINTHTRKTIVVGNLLQPTSLAVLEEYLYWIDRDQQVIERVDKLTGENQSRMLRRMTHLTDLVTVSVTQDPYSNPCFDNNGGCSHLCFVNEEGTKYCSCPTELILNKNKKSCISQPSPCPAEGFKCYDSAGCVPDTWRCDGQVECDDSSDENNCGNCKPHQYKCNSNKCIDHTLLCDGVPNCPGGDDETCCEKDQYYCASLKKCITLPLICRTAECSEMDEAYLHCKQAVGLIKMETTFESKANYTIGIVVAVVVLFIIGLMSYFCKRKSLDIDDADDFADSNMTTKPLTQHKTQTLSLLQPIIVPSHCSANDSSSSMCMGHISGNGCQHYNRNHVLGASSNSSMGTPYPQETLNPPPSPVTVLSQYTEYCSSHGMPPRRVYQCLWSKSPPHPTPCSTDVCDDSESYSYDHRYCNGRTESSYDSDPYPPPPTPRSHCFSDDNCGTCPPSPSTTVQSFYNPLPPPPSPGPESDS